MEESERGRERVNKIAGLCRNQSSWGKGEEGKPSPWVGEVEGRGWGEKYQEELAAGTERLILAFFET